MADFETALKMVLQHEGGYVDNPNDTPTNYGITQAVLADYVGHSVTKDEVKNLSMSTARKIYFERYWKRIKADTIEAQDVANHVMDMAVLRGVVAAGKAIQTAVGGVKVDGVVGPVTIAALNRAPAPGFLISFMKLCVSAFANIVTADPRKLEFLRNWCSRALEMSAAVSTLLCGK